MPPAILALDRDRILAFRRRVGLLDARHPYSPDTLRRAAWAGLQDSMPRAALLSLHARLQDVDPSSWEDPALVQLWGPRYSAYAVPAEDVAVFTRGRLPADAKGRRRAEDTAERLDAFLAGRRMTYSEAGHAMGVPPNALRYAAPTGRVLMRWDGARKPEVWSQPAPDLAPAAARRELARRYLHVFGPTTPASFLRWAGIRRGRGGDSAFDELEGELTPVRTPLGEAWALTSDLDALRAPTGPPAAARLLPSGDAYTLLQGEDRALLVPDAAQREALWPSRVWPGALLLDGEVAGTWRRSGKDLTLQPWRALSPAERDAVEAEAIALPLPELAGELRLRWA